MTVLRLTIVLASVTFVLASVTFAGAALAQGTPQQRAACRGDVVRLCKGIEGTDAIHGCLQSKYSQVSARCQKVLSGQG